MWVDSRLGRLPQATTANQFLCTHICMNQRHAFHRVGYACMHAAWQLLHTDFFQPLVLLLPVVPPLPLGPAPSLFSL